MTVVNGHMMQMDITGETNRDTTQELSPNLETAFGNDSLRASDPLIMSGGVGDPQENNKVYDNLERWLPISNVGGSHYNVEKNYSDAPTNGKMPQTGRQGTVYVLSWNVSGLSSKIVDNDWRGFIQKFTICVFQETWDVLDIPMNGYISFHIPAISTKVGRYSWGLVMWVNISLPFRSSYLAGQCLQ